MEPRRRLELQMITKQHTENVLWLELNSLRHLKTEQSLPRKSNGKKTHTFYSFLMLSSLQASSHYSAKGFNRLKKKCEKSFQRISALSHAHTNFEVSLYVFV